MIDIEHDSLSLCGCSTLFGLKRLLRNITIWTAKLLPLQVLTMSYLYTTEYYFDKQSVVALPGMNRAKRCKILLSHLSMLIPPTMAALQAQTPIFQRCLTPSRLFSFLRGLSSRIANGHCYTRLQYMLNTTAICSIAS